MKVALCLYGQPRHLDNSYTWLSHKYHIIDKYNADVFCHSWISGEETSFEYADQVRENLKIKEHKDSAKIILDKYKPKKNLFEPPKNFSLEHIRDLIKQKEIEYTSKIAGSFNWSINNENNHLSQLYSISKSIELLQNEEKYDWVILSRYDNYIYNFPNLYQLEKNNLYIDNVWLSTFSDVLVIGSQDQIETFNCFDRIPELTKKIYYFCPEEYKRVAYQEKYSKEGPESMGPYGYTIGQERRIRIEVGVVRSNSLENIQM